MDFTDMSFWQGKTQIRRSDKIFSDYIRGRDDWHCVYKFRCNGLIDYRFNPGGLTTSHFLKRRHESVRFDPENCDSACRSCHAFIEDTVEGKHALEGWKLNQLGKRRYQLLHVRSLQHKRRDDVMDLLVAKALFKDLKRSTI